MANPLRTSDETFKRRLSEYTNRTRASLNRIEEVVSNVDVFAHDEFLFELRKVMDHAEEAEALAIRYAVRRLRAP